LIKDTVVERWVINRIGLINFWYYDEEEFHFKDGRLLLRGANGSGKSVTMQSFIPLLLDGNKSPERLDPFGSRARRLENYLIGEEESAKEESTGYLYMEFVKPAVGHHLTIGMGLKAKRGKSLDFWGFSIRDGRRVGRDFFLYKDLGEKIPLSKIELKNRIGSGGQVLDSQGDYMAMVNELLFGFESLDEYDELIKLLVQLRTPKLSKDFKPTVIYEIMNNSLQPLSDEDLRPMSEAIENMDNIKSQLEVLQASKKSAGRISLEADKYNRFVLMEKARDVVDSVLRHDQLASEETSLKKSIAGIAAGQAQAVADQEALESEQRSVAHKQKELEKHDSFRARQEADRLQIALSAIQAESGKKQNSLAEKGRKSSALQAGIKANQDKQAQHQQELQRRLDQMSAAADSLSFDDHNFFRAELEKDLGQEFDFKMIRKDVDLFKERVTSGRQALEQEGLRNQAYDQCLRLVELAKNEKQEAARQLEKAEMLFSEMKTECIEAVYRWHKANQYLKLDEGELAETARRINSFGTAGDYNDVVAVPLMRKAALDESYGEKTAAGRQRKNSLLEDLHEKQRELQTWTSQKDPVPIREKGVAENRQRLSEAGIAHLPLYLAVDFLPEVAPLQRTIIEEALADMGILDALIIPPADFSKVLGVQNADKDRYIAPQAKFFRQNLSLYMKPVVPPGGDISYALIDDVIKSIVVDDDGDSAYIGENATYTLGILRGKVSAVQSPRFLGLQARKKYRQENIDRLEAELRQLQEEIAAATAALNELAEIRETLRREIDSFPSKQDLALSYRMLASAGLQLEQKSKELSGKENEADTAYQDLKEAKEKVRQATARLGIPQSLEGYMQAEAMIDGYRDHLRVVETDYLRMRQCGDQAVALQSQREDILADLDELSLEVKNLNREIQDHQEKLGNFQELLAQSDFQEISRQMDHCLRRMREIPMERDGLIKLIAAGERDLAAKGEQLNTVSRQLARQEVLRRLCADNLQEEIKLGYFKGTADFDAPLETIAKKLYQQLKQDDKGGNRLRDDFGKSLQDSYHQNRTSLTEYNLKLDYIFDQNDSFDQDDEFSADREMNLIKQRRKRLDLMARVNGRDVNFQVLQEFIEQSVEENEKLLKESDRQLFEDILANTVGKKIRAKIYHGNEWVKKMNGLMESMNTSSGLSFSLSWKSRRAEAEEQIDTVKLVELLKSDAKLLSEEQMDSLAAHFRSKIAAARKAQEDNRSEVSFHALMREILDYRKWFEFQLSYTKLGETKKELTNNAFFRFSGGEKAMAMYVPLFSSVYARYDGARKDAPRIISLDEAFAGVDENNIRDMFRLVEELQLSYIINSQVLWGDYDSIPSLAICELIRPNNADFVTVIRYHWNGKIKELDPPDFYH